MVTVTEARTTRVAVLAASEEAARELAGRLAGEGLDIALSGDFAASSLRALDGAAAHVLLVDLGEEIESEITLIDGLLEHSELPILFNDRSGDSGKGHGTRRLARKLRAMASQAQPAPTAEPEPATPEAGAGPVEDTQATGVVERPEGAAENVWVLGASLGGPQAVREFLEAVDGDLPVAFVLAQHIGANHVELLARQLNRVSAFRVLPARLGHVLRHGEVILAPAEHQLQFTEDGYVAFGPAPEDAVYAPSIDHVMAAVASTYRDRVGAIVFSGMGDDGAEGCLAVARHGGIVWAQDVKSCVISSMPDQARKTNTVTFSASPQAMAQHLYDYFRDSD